MWPGQSTVQQAEKTGPRRSSIALASGRTGRQVTRHRRGDSSRSWRSSKRCDQHAGSPPKSSHQTRTPDRGRGDQRETERQLPQPDDLRGSGGTAFSPPWTATITSTHTEPNTAHREVDERGGERDQRTGQFRDVTGPASTTRRVAAGALDPAANVTERATARGGRDHPPREASVPAPRMQASTIALTTAAMPTAPQSSGSRRRLRLCVSNHSSTPKSAAAGAKGIDHVAPDERHRHRHQHRT